MPYHLATGHRVTEYQRLRISDTRTESATHDFARTIDKSQILSAIRVGLFQNVDGTARLVSETRSTKSGGGQASR
jgi:hypothetical protein